MNHWVFWAFLVVWFLCMMHTLWSNNLGVVTYTAIVALSLTLPVSIMGFMSLMLNHDLGFLIAIPVALVAIIPLFRIMNLQDQDFKNRMQSRQDEAEALLRKLGA